MRADLSCESGHAHVAASGTCAACRLPVLFSGPLPDDDAPPPWLATPFTSSSAARCRRAAGGPHQVTAATATCTCCNARLYGMSLGDGATCWIEPDLAPIPTQNGLQ